MSTRRTARGSLSSFSGVAILFALSNATAVGGSAALNLFSYLQRVIWSCSKCHETCLILYHFVIVAEKGRIRPSRSCSAEIRYSIEISGEPERHALCQGRGKFRFLSVFIELNRFARYLTSTMCSAFPAPPYRPECGCCTCCCGLSFGQNSNLII